MKRLAPIIALLAASAALIHCFSPDDAALPDAGLPRADASSDRPSSDAGSKTDASEATDASPANDAGPADAALPAGDASTSSDAGPSDAGIQDGGTSSEASCTFNSDCQAQERCECTEEEGCRCLLGERGTGLSGIDTCVDGNDCESSLCIEGNGGNFYCSGPCASSDDCGPKLPICASISMLGRVCIRDPNAGKAK